MKLKIVGQILTCPLRTGPGVELGSEQKEAKNVAQTIFDGLLSSEVEPSVSGPPRRYYTITDEGRETLTLWTEIWSQMKIL